MRLTVLSLILAVALTGCTETNSSNSNDDRCAETLLGSKTICGDELVQFCKERYDPDVNADTCEPVLRDAGIDPKTLIPQPPARANIGDPVVIEGEDGNEVRVTAQRLEEELQAGEYDDPGPNRRYVGLHLKIKNVGRGDFSDYPTPKLRLDNGRAVESTIITEGECSDDDASVDLAPGDQVTMCVPFAVSYDRRVDGVQLKIGTEGFVARWRAS